jgi:type I restriction enzyme M protein
MQQRRADRPFHEHRVQRHGEGLHLLGRVYEYFTSEFASNAGKRGGDFHTPKAVVELIVEMLEPVKGRLYQPCFGSGSFMV